MAVRTNYWLIFTAIHVVFSIQLKARPIEEEDNFIIVSGIVNCVDPINGRLALVSVYNISRNWGTFTGVNGEFKIKMAKYDTIIFFTEAHKDFYYVLKPGEAFKDHSISVYLETDAIWLETVNIIGLSSLEEFKLDVLTMQVAENSISIIRPDLNKYAKERLTGKPVPVLIGPLSYLQQKFSKQNQMRKKIQSFKD